MLKHGDVQCLLIVLCKEGLYNNSQHFCKYQQREKLTLTTNHCTQTRTTTYYIEKLTLTTTHCTQTRTTTYYIEKLTLTTNKDHDILHRKTNSHHNPLNTHKDHDIIHRKPRSQLCKAHQCGGVKSINGILTLICTNVSVLYKRQRIPNVSAFNLILYLFHEDYIQRQHR